MTKKIVAAFAFVAICAALFTGSAYAGSMLSSTPGDASDGLIIIGEKNDAEDVSGINTKSETDLYVTLRHKMDKIWGAQAVERKMVQEKEDIVVAAETSNYPPIYINYRAKSKSASYRYKHLYSSRHKGGSSNYLNITPIIVREAKKNNIPPLLLKAVIQTESGFNPYATSPAGAMGLCQMIPSTARVMGVRQPYDPEQSIKGGAKYLGILKRMFKSTDLVLAAYNAGPGAVSRNGGVPNYSETRHYIRKVRKNMKW